MRRAFGNGSMGLTLVEVVIALTVVVIVAGIAGVGALRSRDAANESDVQRALVTLVQAQDRYASQHNTFATSTSALRSFGWSTPASMNARVLDVTERSYCAEVWRASDPSIIASVRTGERVLLVGCDARVSDAGGTLDGDEDPQGSASVAQLSFGRVEVGTLSTLSFTLTNTGGGVISGGANVASPFTVLSGSSYTLNAGESASITIGFGPVEEGDFDEVVRLSGRNVPAGVNVTGVGFEPPLIAVSPDELDFGTVQAGETSIRSFTVTNDGGDPLVGSVSVPTGFEIVSGSSYNLARDESQSVTLRFVPNASRDWNETATLSGAAETGSVTLRGVSHWPPSLDATPDSLSFGTVELGQSETRTFSVHNVGEGILSGSASVSAPYSIVSGGTYALSAGESQSVTVRFEPSMVGTHSATLSLSGGGGGIVNLTGHARLPPEIGVAPSSLAFGGLEIGTSSTMSVTVTNVGDGTLSGTASASAPFTIVSGASYSLSANESQEVRVRFTPPSANSWNETLTLSGGNGASVPLTGSGHPPAAVEVTPQALDFGLVPINTSATETFTVHNSGGGTLTGSASVTSGPVSITSGGSYSLNAGESQTVTIRWEPTSVTSLSGSISLSGGGGATVTVTGEVDPDPTLSVPVTSLAFGEVLLGEDKSLTFTVSNTGGGRLIGTASTSAPFAITQGGSYDLGSGQAQTVRVRFAPTVRGAASGSVTLSGAHGGSVALSGQGIIAGTVSVTPTQLSFGAVEVGTSTTLSVVVRNVGDTSVSGNASIANPFSIASGGSYTLAPNATQTVVVRFTPNAVQSWSRDLSVTGGAGATVLVSGSGYEPAAFTVSPTSVSFPNTRVGESSSGSVSITNTGSVAGTANLSVSAPFEVTSSTSVYLAGGASASVSVRFAPTAAGSFSRSLSVSGGAGGAVSATLSGVGVHPAQIAITPTSWNAGAVQVGTSASRTVTVSNTGGETLSGSVSSVGDFVVVSGASYAIAGGSSHTLTLRFRPTQWDAQSATLAFSGGGGASLSVSGSGYARLSRTSIDFGDQNVNTRSGWQNVRIYNDSPNRTLSGSASTSAPFELHNRYRNYSIAPGSSRVVYVRFYPRSRNTFDGELTLTNTGREPLPLTGRGVRPPTLQVSTTSYTFPYTTVGNTRTHSVTVTNIGDGTMSGTFGRGTSTQYPHAVFVPSGSFSLGSDQSITITTTYAPPIRNNWWGSLAIDAGAAGSATVTYGTNGVGRASELITLPRANHPTQIRLYYEIGHDSAGRLYVDRRVAGDSGSEQRLGSLWVSRDGYVTVGHAGAGSSTVFDFEYRGCFVLGWWGGGNEECPDWESPPQP